MLTWISFYKYSAQYSPQAVSCFLHTHYQTNTAERGMTISCFLVGYCEIEVKIFFNLTLVTPVKILIFMFLLIACASQPDGNMTVFTLNFLCLM